MVNSSGQSKGKSFDDQKRADALHQLLDQVKQFMAPSKKDKEKTRQQKAEKEKKSRFTIEKLSGTKPVISNPTTPTLTSRPIDIPYLLNESLVPYTTQTVGRFRPITRSEARTEMTLMQLTNLMSLKPTKANQTLPIFKTSLNDKSTKTPSIIGLFEKPNPPVNSNEENKKKTSPTSRLRTNSCSGFLGKKSFANAE